jgi:hypothetical protein
LFFEQNGGCYYQRASLSLKKKHALDDMRGGSGAQPCRKQPATSLIIEQLKPCLESRKFLIACHQHSMADQVKGGCTTSSLIA